MTEKLKYSIVLHVTNLDPVGWMKTTRERKKYDAHLNINMSSECFLSKTLMCVLYYEYDEVSILDTRAVNA